jgi:hypothetical protein
MEIPVTEIFTAYPFQGIIGTSHVRTGGPKPARVEIVQSATDSIPVVATSGAD